MASSYFGFDFIKKNRKEWEALLEVIADYLVNPTPWFTIDDNGIQFYDGEECENYRGMVAAHFRHSTIKKEVAKAKAQWKNVPSSIKHKVRKKLMTNKVEGVYQLSIIDTFFWSQ